MKEIKINITAYLQIPKELEDKALNDYLSHMIIVGYPIDHDEQDMTVTEIVVDKYHGVN